MLSKLDMKCACQYESASICSLCSHYQDRADLFDICRIHPGSVCSCNGLLRGPKLFANKNGRHSGSCRLWFGLVKLVSIIRPLWLKNACSWFSGIATGAMNHVFTGQVTDWLSPVQVDYFVKSGMAVGLGTGRASGMAINYIGRKLRDGSLRNIVGVPMWVFPCNSSFCWQLLTDFSLEQVFPSFVVSM